MVEQEPARSELTNTRRANDADTTVRFNTGWGLLHTIRAELDFEDGDVRALAERTGEDRAPKLTWALMLRER